MSKELQRKAVYIVANNVILKNATWPKLFSISSELTLVLQIQEERMLTILKAFQSNAKLYLLLDIPLGRAPIGTWWKSRAPSTRPPLTKRLNHSASGKEKNWVNTRRNDKPLEYHYSFSTIGKGKKKKKFLVLSKKEIHLICKREQQYTSRMSSKLGFILTLPHYPSMNHSNCHPLPNLRLEVATTLEWFQTTEQIYIHNQSVTKTSLYQGQFRLNTDKYGLNWIQFIRHALTRITTTKKYQFTESAFLVKNFLTVCTLTTGQP